MSERVPKFPLSRGRGWVRASFPFLNNSSFYTRSYPPRFPQPLPTLPRLKLKIEEPLNATMQILPRLQKRLVASALVALNLVAASPFVRAADKTTFDILEIRTPPHHGESSRVLTEQPITVTASHSDRSAGRRARLLFRRRLLVAGSDRPKCAPYIQHDGLTNTNNFVEHRHAMVRLSEIVGTMASAYILTGDEKYAQQAVKHIKAWFNG